MAVFIPTAIKFVLFHAQWSTLILAGVMVLVLCYYLRSEQKAGEAPGPRPWPIIGSLHLMAGYKIPFAAFTALKVTAALHFDYLTLQATVYLMY
jgi:hypothetical protein